MDVFRFINPNAQTKMENGEIINGFTSKMWIERYNSAGEFKLVGPISAGVREALPIGSFVSHVNSKDIMIVENHEINDSAGKESMVTISGRGFETFFEHKITGTDAQTTYNEFLNYTIPQTYTWIQASLLLKRWTSDPYIDPAYALLGLTQLFDNIPYINVSYETPSGFTGEQIARNYPSFNTVYKDLMDLLAIDGFGIKVLRPSILNPSSIAAGNLGIIIHRGVDRSNKIVFSYDNNEITSADYLWSNKNFSNAVVVGTTYSLSLVTNEENTLAHRGINRRMMYIEAKWIDSNLTFAEYIANNGAQADIIHNIANVYGRQILASQNHTVLAKVEVAKGNATTGTYRVDYDVGDIIMVSGDYNESSKMRISEYVETEDATGESGYPTLTLL